MAANTFSRDTSLPEKVTRSCAIPLALTCKQAISIINTDIFITRSILVTVVFSCRHRHRETAKAVKVIPLLIVRLIKQFPTVKKLTLLRPGPLQQDPVSYCPLV